MAILAMNNISKSFSGLEVLHEVNFRLCEGEIHALVGENGAGKSTLVKILMGEYQPDEGQITLNSETIQIKSPAKALELGIAMVPQELHLIKNLSVADYMLLGKEPRNLCFIDTKEKIELTKKYLKRIGLMVDQNSKMGDLSVSEIQMIEIAKVLSYGSKIIILDEPTSSLSEVEAKRLFEILLYLKSQGVSIIYISHRLEELFLIADRVTILRDGYLIDCKDIADVNRDTIIQMMVGRRLEEVYPPVNLNIGDETICINGFTKKGRFKDISFCARKGEVLGIAGLVGAGRTEIMLSIFGQQKLDKGTLSINGGIVIIKNFKDTVKKGIAFVTEDRKRYGLNLLGSVRDNIVLVSYEKLSKMGFIDNQKVDKSVQDMIKHLNIITETVNKKVKFLSGGNQQKIVLAKWLLMSPEIIIMDEPTRGIDVGAKAEIYKLINNFAKQGKTAIIISSELPELIGLCNRVIVLRDGEITGELLRDELNQEDICHMASG